MKSKIEKLAHGVFEKTKPELELSILSIEAAVQTGGVISGSFTITGINGIEIKGLLYADSSRVHLDQMSFIGTQAIIRYEIETRGMIAGSELSGDIQIVSNSGEYILPYRIQIEAPYTETSMGRIHNLFHFTNLVRNNYDEALKLFCSDDFSKIFLNKNPKAATIYDSLMKGISPMVALEEFLVFVNKKSRVFLSLSDSRKEYFASNDEIGDKIILTKANWGYLEIDLCSDGDFLHLEKHKITSDDFAGSVYEITYTIKKEKIHAGNNWGKIIIKTPYQELTCVIEVINKRKTEDQIHEARIIKTNKKELADLYFAFRLHKLSTEAWCKKSLKLLKKILIRDNTQDFFYLMQIQVLAVQKKISEAQVLLQAIEDKILAVQEKQIPLYCYYLYVKTLVSRDIVFGKNAAFQVKNYYENGFDDWRILWILLYLDEEYDSNKSLRLIRMKEQYNHGCYSPYFYFETCFLINEQPGLIRVLNGFELQSIWWGCKHHFISEKAAVHIAEVASLEKHYHPILHKILTSLYEKYHSRIILESILTLLIKNSLYGEAYLSWYNYGVQAGLKLTGLYEGFVNSLSEDYSGVLPRAMVMYFIFENTLDDYKKAILYRNIIENQDNDPSMMKNYLPAITSFAVEQIMKGNINKNLAFIYQKIIHKEIISEELAGKYPKLLLTKRLYCSDTSLKFVIVRHKEIDEEWRIPFVRGEAYFPIYTEDYAILFEDGQQRRFCRHVEYEIHNILDAGKWIPYCYKKNRGDIYLWLYLCNKEGHEDIELLKYAAESEELKDFYHNQLLKRIVDFYTEHYDGEELEFFLKQIHYQDMEPAERRQITELFLVRAMYKEAEEALRYNGYEGIASGKLLKFCMYMLWADDGEKNEFLLKLCVYVFFKGKYDETLLEYMIKYYNGTTKNMLRLWQAASDFSCDTVLLEERLLTQMLFTDSFAVQMIDVFEAYYKKGPKELIVKAYLAHQAYEYIVKKLVISDKTFEIIEREWKNKEKLLDICKMALLKYYSERKSLSDERIQTAQSLVTELLRKGKLFSFYKKFEKFFALPIFLRDKLIFEYYSHNDVKIKMHYIIETGTLRKKHYEIEEMDNIYDGIFEKHFILFYGENLQYYLSEKEKEQECLTESDEIKINEWSTNYGESRFHLLNDMYASFEMNDNQTLHELVQTYVKKKYLAENCFELME